MKNGQVLVIVLISIGIGIVLGAFISNNNYFIGEEVGEPKIRTKDIRHSYTVEVKSMPIYRGLTAGMEYQLLYLDQDRVGEVRTHYEATSSYTPKFHQGEILILTTNGYGTVVNLKLKI